MVKVTGSTAAAVGGTAVSGTEVAGAEVAGGAVAGVPPHALMIIEVTTSSAIVTEILLVFILSSFLSYG
jgi:hypothetical protein